MANSQKTTVYFDGACPLCEREIAMYRRCRGASDVEWVDVSASNQNEVAPGLTKVDAMARFHVRGPDGSLASGGDAFAKLWQALPAFRMAGRVFELRPLAWLLNRLYDSFLTVRPRLQSLARARADAANNGYPSWLVRDLRSDHAGETGAVWIYRGILAVSRESEIRRFAEAHLETEQNHLVMIEEVLAPKNRSLLLPLWRVAGFITGALPALAGKRAVFATIDAVETFVDHHYAEQIARLDQVGTHHSLRALLERCRLDEVHHRDEAREALDVSPGILTRLWCWAVRAGSATAVGLARRV